METYNRFPLGYVDETLLRTYDEIGLTHREKDENETLIKREEFACAKFAMEPSNRIPVVVLPRVTESRTKFEIVPLKGPAFSDLSTVQLCQLLMSMAKLKRFSMRLGLFEVTYQKSVLKVDNQLELVIEPLQAWNALAFCSAYFPEVAILPGMIHKGKEVRLTHDEIAAFDGVSWTLMKDVPLVMRDVLRLFKMLMDGPFTGKWSVTTAKTFPIVANHMRLVPQNQRMSIPVTYNGSMLKLELPDREVSMFMDQTLVEKTMKNLENASPVSFDLK